MCDLSLQAFGPQRFRSQRCCSSHPQDQSFVSSAVLGRSWPSEVCTVPPVNCSIWWHVCVLCDEGLMACCSRILPLSPSPKYRYDHAPCFRGRIGATLPELRHTLVPIVSARFNPAICGWNRDHMTRSDVHSFSCVVVCVCQVVCS